MTGAFVVFLIPVIAVAVGMIYANKRGAHHRPEYDRIA